MVKGKIKTTRDQLKNKKLLEIEIKYKTQAELIRILDEIKRKVHNGVPYFKNFIEGGEYEYELNYLSVPDWKIETINGKQCMVIQSKMNKKIKQFRI